MASFRIFLILRMPQRRKPSMTRIPLVFLLLSAASLMAADLVPAPLFNDGAVLQRDREIPV